MDLNGSQAKKHRVMGYWYEDKMIVGEDHLIKNNMLCKYKGFFFFFNFKNLVFFAASALSELGLQFSSVQSLSRVRLFVTP